MGIEDFSLEERYTDQVVLLTRDYEYAAQVSRTLQQQELQITVAENEPNGEQRFDAVVLDCRGEAASAEKRLARIRELTEWSRPVYVILVGAISDPLQQALEQNRSTVVLSGDPKPSEIAIRLSVQLRLRRAQRVADHLESDTAIQNAQLRDLTNRFQRELLEARNLQQSLLPRKLPKHPSCVIAAAYDPLEAVGGDLYDVFVLDADRIGLFIGDVAGHGLSAAFLAAMTKLALNVAIHRGDAGEILSEMNRVLCPVMPDGRFVTALVVVFDAKQKTLSVARAGHPVPLVTEANDGVFSRIEELDAGGLPLGVTAEFPYVAAVRPFPAGSRIFLYTDGLLESRNRDGEMFGPGRLKDACQAAVPTKSLSDSIKMILGQIQNFRGSRRLLDDITLMALEHTA